MFKIAFNNCLIRENISLKAKVQFLSYINSFRLFSINYIQKWFYTPLSMQYLTKQSFYFILLIKLSQFKSFQFASAGGSRFGLIFFTARQHPLSIQPFKQETQHLFLSTVKYPPLFTLQVGCFSFVYFQTTFKTSIMLVDLSSSSQILCSSMLQSGEWASFFIRSFLNLRSILLACNENLPFSLFQPIKTRNLLKLYMHNFAQSYYSFDNFIYCPSGFNFSSRKTPKQDPLGQAFSLQICASLTISQKTERYKIGNWQKAPVGLRKKLQVKFWCIFYSTLIAAKITSSANIITFCQFHLVSIQSPPTRFTFSPKFSSIFSPEYQTLIQQTNFLHYLQEKLKEEMNKFCTIQISCVSQKSWLQLLDIHSWMETHPKL